MKILFITATLAATISALIISLDLIMGISYEGIFWKAINPFRVMEPAEYIIIILFIVFYLIDSLAGYLKKRKKENPSN